jgi:hypothetical protein
MLPIETCCLLFMRDVERILKGAILALISYFGYLAEIFMIGCSFVSLMQFLPSKCRMVPWACFQLLQDT